MCVFTVALGRTVDVNPVIVMNPGGPRSATGTPFSVTDVVSMETEGLLRSIEAGGGEESRYGKRKQEVLKTLVRREVVRDDRRCADPSTIQSLRRDGTSCLLTGLPFQSPSGRRGVKPILAHIIPHSIHDKVRTFVP
jgi:hypothetical protein